MDRAAFELMAAAERDHWWFRGRREIIAAALELVVPAAGARLLDAGCGSGGNLALLSRFGDVSAFEFDGAARAAAESTGPTHIEFGALPDAIPFPDRHFDVIGLFDVLEHLEKPVESLAALAARLGAAGAIVITVPALPMLWGPHDVHHQHFRRYTSRTLRAHVEAAGLRLEYHTYFNALLLPVAIAQRVRERLVGYSTGNLMPGHRLNEWLFRIFSLERRWIPRHSLPVGLSLLAIARRPGEGPR